MRLVGSSEMRAIDRAAIEDLGISGLALMERAGGAVAKVVGTLAAPAGHITVVCGGGNNGGDGYVAARLLRGAGRNAAVVSLVAAEKLTGDARATCQQAVRAGVAIGSLEQLAAMSVSTGDVLVDAIFGTGLARPPEGIFAEAIRLLNAWRARGARVVAVDVPSGLSADTGRPLGICVTADRTVALAFLKRGLLLHPGAELAGEVTVADIGIPPAAAERVPISAEVLTEEEARHLLPERSPEAHKGDAGRVLVIAGSTGKTGAAHLALCGALRGGAGLVTLAARPEVIPMALAGRPEAMSLQLPDSGPLGLGDLGVLLDAAGQADALVIGPGISRGPETAALLRALLDGARTPSVLDADALTALAEDPALLRGLPPGVILTPHPGEMARLAKTTIDAVQAARIEIAAARAKEWGVTLVLKGARTVVADAESAPTVIPTGNPGMATGGTGDVLAGLVGALLAGGLAPSVAARLGAWVHGRAGDLAVRRQGQRGLIASDLVEALGAVWVEWKR